MSFIVKLLEPILYPSFKKARASGSSASLNDIEILGRGTVTLKDEAIKHRLSEISKEDLDMALRKSYRVETSISKK